MPTEEFIRSFLGGKGTLALLVAIITQASFMLIWAVKQEARITSLEMSLTSVLIRLEREVDVTTALTNRIDRQETPLGRRVEQVENRLLSRIVALESRVNEIFARPR